MTSQNQHQLLKTMPAKYWLDARPLLPGSIKSAQGGKLVADLNCVVTVPKFTCTHPAWAGASIITARTKLDVGTPWAIKQPTKIYSDFVLCIKWVTDGVVYRYKLWDNELAKVNFPFYYGEVIPANSILEFWSVEDVNAITLTEDLTLEATLKSTPTELYKQTRTTLFAATDTCATYSTPLPVTWDEFMAHCL